MPERSPLARLVLFMVCLAVAGSILGGAHYYAVDIPQQNALQPPQNADSSNQNCKTCKHNCKIDLDYYLCLSICEDLECSG